MAVSLEMKTKAIAATLQAEQDRQAQQLRSAVTAAEQPLQAQITYMMEQVDCARKQAANSGKNLLSFNCCLSFSTHHLCQRKGAYGTICQKLHVMHVSYCADAAKQAAEAELAQERLDSQRIRVTLLQHDSGVHLNTAASTEQLLASVLAFSTAQSQQHQLSEANSRLLDLSTQLHNARSQLDDKASLSETLQEQLRQAQEALVAASVAAQAHADNEQDLSDQLRQSQAASEDLIADYEESEQELNNMYTQLGDTKRQRDKVARDVQTQWVDIQNIRLSRDKAEVQAKEAQHRLADLTHQLTASEACKNELSTMLRAENQSDHTLQQHVSQLTATFGTTQQALCASRHQSADLQSQIGVERNTHKEHTSALQQQVDELNAELLQAVQTIAERQNNQAELEQLQHNLAQATAAVDTMQAQHTHQLDVLKRDITTLKAQLSSALQARQTLAAQVRDLQRSLSAAGKMSTARLHAEPAEQQANALRKDKNCSKLVHAQQDTSALRGINVKSKQTLTDAKQQHAAQLRRLQKEVADLKTALTAAHKAPSEAAAQAVKLRSNLAASKQEIDGLKADLTKAQEKVKTFRDRSIAHQGAVSRLYAQLGIADSNAAESARAAETATVQLVDLKSQLAAQKKLQVPHQPDAEQTGSSKEEQPVGDGASTTQLPPAGSPQDQCAAQSSFQHQAEPLGSSKALVGVEDADKKRQEPQAAALLGEQTMSHALKEHQVCHHSTHVSELVCGRLCIVCVCICA